MSDAATFFNRLKILRSLDRHELVEAGCLNLAPDSWKYFRADPLLGIIQMSDAQRAALFQLIQKRGG